MTTSPAANQVRNALKLQMTELKKENENLQFKIHDAAVILEENKLLQQRNAQLQLKLMVQTSDAVLQHIEREQKTVISKENTILKDMLSFYGDSTLNESSQRMSLDVSANCLLSLNAGPWAAFKKLGGKRIEVRLQCDFNLMKAFGKHGRFTKGRGQQIMDFKFPSQAEYSKYGCNRISKSGRVTDEKITLADLRSNTNIWKYCFDPAKTNSVFSEEEFNEFFKRAEQNIKEKRKLQHYNIEDEPIVSTVITVELCTNTVKLVDCVF
jgi:hypothetical protein